MATMQHQVWINARAARVYEALATAEAIGTWWDKPSPVRTEAGLVLEFSPGPEHGVLRLKVLEQTLDRRVEWECISTHPKTSPASAWTGTHLVFEISERQPPSWLAPSTEVTTMTVLEFRHTGWDEHSAFFGFCNFAWAGVLGALKRVCEGPRA